MTREQLLAVGNGLIGLGCSFFEVSVLALLFTPGPWPPMQVIAVMLVAGIVFGGLLWWIGYEMIGTVEP